MVNETDSKVRGGITKENCLSINRLDGLFPSLLLVKMKSGGKDLDFLLGYDYKYQARQAAARAQHIGKSLVRLHNSEATAKSLQNAHDLLDEAVP